jgi:hypothetical protein
MGTPLQHLAPGDASVSGICSVGTGLIIIGTLWLGQPNRLNARVQRDVIGVAFLAAGSTLGQ